MSAPTLDSSQPENLETGVDPAIQLVYSFSDLVGTGADPDTCSLKIREHVGPGAWINIITLGVAQAGFGDAAAIDVGGGAVVFSTQPDSPFAFGTQYDLSIDISDHSANAAHFDLTFTTEPDPTPPTLDFTQPGLPGTVPTNGAVDWPPDSAIDLVFADPDSVDASAIQISIQPKGHPELAEDIAINGVLQGLWTDGGVGADGATCEAFATRSSPLEWFTTYQLSVDVADLLGNEAHFDLEFRTAAHVSFETGGLFDFLPPVLTSHVPEDAASDVAIDTSFELVLTDVAPETVTPAGIDPASLQWAIKREDEADEDYEAAIIDGAIDTSSPLVWSGTVTPSIDGVSISAAFTCGRVLSPSTTYVVRIQVADLLGNAAEFIVTFTTSADPGLGPPTDHCTSALDRLIAQYKGKRRIEALICALVDPCQGIEDAGQEILAGRTLELGAVGAQLDQIGDLLGLAREGLADEVYRVRLIARGQVISSTGMPEEIRAILTTLLGGLVPRLREEPPGATVLFAPEALAIEDGEAYARILRDAAPAGTRVLLEYDPQVDAPLFVFAEWGEDPTTATPLLEWGEDPGTGHALSESVDGWFGATE